MVEGPNRDELHVAGGSPGPEEVREDPAVEEGPEEMCGGSSSRTALVNLGSLLSQTGLQRFDPFRFLSTRGPRHGRL